MLIAQSGPLAGQRWALTGDSLLIGRDIECDVIIPERQVSRQHARLRRAAQGGFEVEDLNSKNGTYINGQQLHGSQQLVDGDIIQIALAAKLVYVDSEATVPLRLETTPTGQVVSVGRLRLDSAARRVWVGPQEIDPPLSVQQFRFLELLYQHPGQVCSREMIVSTVWDEADSSGVSEQALDALVRRVRDRLAEIDPQHAYVVTVRGHGFRLDNPPQ